MSGQDFVVVFTHDHARLDRFVGRIAEQQNWRRVGSFEQTAIFVRNESRVAVDSATNKALLVGIAFDSNGSTGHARLLGGYPIEKLHERAFDSIFARYWGAFVAIGVFENELRLARDPSGALPCYYAAASGVFLAGSSAGALIDAGLPRPQIAWDGVAKCLYRAGLPAEQTALTGIRELLPGDRLRVRRDQISIEHIWSPWNYVQVSDRSEAEQAAVLQEVIGATVASWVRQFPDVLIGVSGGLDSSIVAACAEKAANSVHAVTVSTADAQGDEHVYAQELCRSLGTTLIEERYDLADMDPCRAVGAHLPRPVGRTIALAYNAAIARAVRQGDACAFFSGNGGDNVFAFSRSAAAIADRYLHESWTSGVWRTTRDICHLTGCGIFRALSAARRIARRPYRYNWRPDRRFLSSQLLAELNPADLKHDWLDAPSDCLPGKAAHIAGLLRIQQHIDGTGSIAGVTVIHPLLSQPIIETCLGIPSWMWCQGGRDRSIARQAFGADLPLTIRHRRSKGGPDGFSAQFLARFRKRIAERILDGHLVRQGIADRSRLESILAADRLDLGAERVRILEILNVEAWIDHWQRNGSALV